MQILDDLRLSTPDGEPYVWEPQRFGGDDYGLGKGQPFGSGRPFYTKGTGGGPGPSDAVPAAYSAVGQISNELEGCSRSLVSKRTQERADHPLNELLASPSRQMDAYHFWMWMYAGVVSSGNSYAYISRDRRTHRPVELVPALCRDTRWEGTQRRRRSFKVELLGDEGRRNRDVGEGGLLTFHGRGFDGLASPSPIQYAARNAIRQTGVLQDALSASLLNGVFAGMMLRIDQAVVSLSPKKREELEAKLKEEYSGALQAGKVVVLPPGVETVEGNKLSAVDLQLIEALKWNVEDIARVWSISPWRLGHFPAGVRRPEFSAENAAFERTACRPWARMADSQMNHVGKLLLRADAADGFAISTDTTQISHGTLQDRVEIAGMAVADYGIWRGNEGRALTGKPPDPEMDKFFTPRGGTPRAGGSSGRPGPSGTDD